MKVWMAPVMALTLANSAAANPLPPPEGKVDVLVEYAPNPTAAFFSGVLPGGGQLYVGQPVKGGIYFGAGILGGLLGYKAFDVIPPGRSTVPHDYEEWMAILYGVGGLCLVGLVGAIDAAYTASAKTSTLDADLESK